MKLLDKGSFILWDKLQYTQPAVVAFCVAPKKYMPIAFGSNYKFIGKRTVLYVFKTGFGFTAPKQTFSGFRTVMFRDTVLPNKGVLFVC